MTIVAILRLLIELVMPLAPPAGRVSASESPVARPGAVVELSVTILDTPMAGTPIELWLSSADLVPVPNRFDNRDVVDPLAAQPRVRARITAPERDGRYGVDAQVSYVSCGPATCRPHRARVHWDVDVVTAVDPAASR